VAERVFLIAEERINLTFHLEDNRVTASTREFVRPPHTAEKGGTLTMTPDMTTSFQVCNKNNKRTKESRLIKNDLS
jgi:hypothetical protein